MVSPVALPSYLDPRSLVYDPASFTRGDL